MGGCTAHSSLFITMASSGGFVKNRLRSPARENPSASYSASAGVFRLRTSRKQTAAPSAFSASSAPHSSALAAPCRCR